MVVSEINDIEARVKDRVADLLRRVEGRIGRRLVKICCHRRLLIDRSDIRRPDKRFYILIIWRKIIRLPVERIFIELAVHKVVTAAEDRDAVRILRACSVLVPCSRILLR